MHEFHLVEASFVVDLCSKVNFFLMLFLARFTNDCFKQIFLGLEIGLKRYLNSGSIKYRFGVFDIVIRIRVIVLILSNSL